MAQAAITNTRSDRIFYAGMAALAAALVFEVMLVATIAILPAAIGRLRFAFPRSKDRFASRREESTRRGSPRLPARRLRDFLFSVLPPVP